MAWTRADHRAYEKTPHGFLMRLYRNMQSRVTGVQKKKAHLYFGLPLLPREDFYLWAKCSKSFWLLWRDWKQSGHDRRLTPTVNRKDSSRGYELDNVEWITHSANSARLDRVVPPLCGAGLHPRGPDSHYHYRLATGDKVTQCKECAKARSRADYRRRQSAKEDRVAA